jgi:hypothetical protein
MTTRNVKMRIAGVIAVANQKAASARACSVDPTIKTDERGHAWVSQQVVIPIERPRQRSASVFPARLSRAMVSMSKTGMAPTGMAKIGMRGTKR